MAKRSGDGLSVRISGGPHREQPAGANVASEASEALLGADSSAGSNGPEFGSKLSESAKVADPPLVGLSNRQLLHGECPQVEEIYTPPTWAEFRTHVINNGNKFVRATYPNPPTDLIETIWCGVPVEHHERARVMTPKREWVDFADAESR